MFVAVIKNVYVDSVISDFFFFFFWLLRAVSKFDNLWCVQLTKVWRDLCYSICFFFFFKFLAVCVSKNFLPYGLDLESKYV